MLDMENLLIHQDSLKSSNPYLRECSLEFEYIGATNAILLDIAPSSPLSSFFPLFQDSPFPSLFMLY